MSRGRVTIGTFRGERGRALARYRPSRRSRRARWIVAAATAMLVVATVAGIWWLLTAPVFAVARVESGPYRFSDEQAVEAALRQTLGRNIWRLSGAEIADACTGLPWVREVRARRRIPDTVAVELIEWRPLLVVPAETAAAVDRVLVADGRVLSLPTHLSPPALPMLVGAELIADRDGICRVTADRAHQLRALLDALATTGFETVCAVDFVRLTDIGVTLELADARGRIRLGRDGFTERLARYLLAREQIPRGAAVDLRFADRITYEPPATDPS